MTAERTQEWPGHSVYCKFSCFSLARAPPLSSVQGPPFHPRRRDVFRLGNKFAERAEDDAASFCFGQEVLKQVQAAYPLASAWMVNTLRWSGRSKSSRNSLYWSVLHFSPTSRRRWAMLSAPGSGRPAGRESRDGNRMAPAIGLEPERKPSEGNERFVRNPPCGRGKADWCFSQNVGQQIEAFPDLGVGGILVRVRDTLLPPMVVPGMKPDFVAAFAVASIWLRHRSPITGPGPSVPRKRISHPYRLAA